MGLRQAPSTARNRIIAVIGVLVAGLSLRITWALIRQGSGATGEAFNVARAIGSGRGFADAYLSGQGPTAHLMPITPSLAGLTYWLFGINSTVAETILTTWALALMVGTYLLVFLIFKHIGLCFSARLGGLTYLAIAPTYIAQEVVDFRIWEGGLTVFLASATIYALIISEQIELISTKRLALLSLLLALLFFVNPIVGAAGFGCASLFAWRRLSARQWLAAGLMTATSVSLFIAPWAIRNERVLGAFVPLRSNGGLELALGQNPHAIRDGIDEGRIFRQRLAEIHPAVDKAPYLRMRSMGEVEYSAQLGRETWSWMIAHPLSAIKLSIRHFVTTFVPRPWQFGDGPLLDLRAFLAAIPGAIGVTTLIILSALLRRSWVYVLVIVIVPALVMSPFQPVPRYTYIYYPWLTFCLAYIAQLTWVQGQRYLINISARNRSTDT